jgi:phosphoribosylformylglycinamidine (FGAM) synthase-like enzyme
MSVDGNSRYCSLSPREGARLLVAECCRNLSTVGALPVAATNNLNFGNPERPEIMAQLVEAIEGISEACRFFETPITGGNVSLYNETLGESIWPTPVMGIVGLLKTAPPVTIAFKKEGQAVLLLGGLGSADAVRFGGTQYAKVVLDQMWGLPPALDMDYEKRVQTAMREIAGAGLAESAHDLGDGGLAVALAECCSGGIGAHISIVGNLRSEFALFHEGPSRILISSLHPEAVEEIARRHNIECVRIGATMKERLRIDHHSATWVDSPVDRLREVSENGLEGLLVPAYA